MKWILEKRNKHFFEINYFHQFRNFDISIEEQLQELDNLKQNLPIEEHIAIDLQKHFLLVTVMIEAASCVNNDNSQEYLEPAANQLNESAMQLYKLFFGEPI